MKKLRLPLAISLALALSAVGTVAVAEVSWRLGLFLGQRSLDLDVADPFDEVETQDQIGVIVSFGEIDWPIMLAIDVMTSSGDGGTTDSYSVPYMVDNMVYNINYVYSVDYDVSTIEVDVGVRRFWRQKKSFAPYVGGGIGIVRFDGSLGRSTNITVTEIPDFSLTNSETLIDGENSDFGFWLNAGVDWQIGKRFTLGLDTRYSTGADGRVKTTQAGADAGLPIGQRELDLSGFHAGLVVGYRWGDIGADE